MYCYKNRMPTILEIVNQLKEAADAYYNTGISKMTDDEYDELRDELERLDPANPFLKIVGAPVTSAGTVKLPVPMPSLNKIKPGTGAIAQFTKIPCSAWILSEKLDGISVLWTPADRKLYLRGDGAVGQDVSHLVKLGLQGLPVRMEKEFRVRGEFVIRKSDVPPNTIGRSWINGVLHRSDPIESDVAKIRFVAYEICSAKGGVGTRQDQMTMLSKLRYEVPWWTVVNRLDEDVLGIALKERRSVGLYDIDGIVVGQDRVPMWQTDPNELRNPKDMVAFKMVLSDQCAETTIVAVHWALSHQGYYIPRLEVEPVRVGGAMITYVTGHNARVIVDKRLGKGARIRIRRSGDVIPTIDGVLVGVNPDLPPSNTWKWMGPEDTAVHIGARGESGSVELLESKLKHFAAVLEIDGLGPGLVKKLVLGGITTPRALCTATVETLSDLIGKKTGVTTAAELRRALSTLTEKKLMIASSVLPRGVGETKLDTLFAMEADPRKWGGSTGRPAGWSQDALSEFLRAYPAYEMWREKEFPLPAYPILQIMTVVTAPVAYKGTVCFSGFRNAALEKRLEALGFMIAATLTKKTTVLVIPDGDASESSKVVKARESGIPVRSQTEFLKEYNILIQ